MWNTLKTIVTLGMVGVAASGLVGCAKNSEAKTKVILQEMMLKELRQARVMSQEKLAEELNIKQSSVSKLEHRADIYISTLRSYIEALGGELNIIAKFPEGQIKINLFHDL